MLFRKILFLAGVICANWVSVEAQSLNDIIDNQLINNNNIKGQTTYDYDYVNGKPTKKGNKSMALKFDNRGNKVEEIGYKQNGEVHYVISYVYDSKGNMLQYEKYEGNRKKLNFKQVYQYDTKGNKVLETGFNGVEEFRTVFNYNAQGKLAEIIYYNGTVIDEKRKLTYDGEVAEILVLTERNVPKFKIYTTFLNGRLVEEKQVENNGTISRQINYVYDFRGNLLEEEKHINGTLAYHTFQVFDDKGKLTEVYQKTASTPKYLAKRYIYDDQSGRLVEEQYRNDSSRDFSKNVYRYQDNGLTQTVDSYFASYNYQVLYVYAYETY